MNTIIVIMNLLHLLATIVWIGAMAMLLFVIIPCGKQVLRPSATFKEFMNSIGKRTTSLVNVSIVIVITTGIILVIFAKSSVT